MIKKETKTITKEVAYCDICGKRLSKKEENMVGPWACLHYCRLYGYEDRKKYEEEHDDFSVALDLCQECNDKMSDIVLEEWYKFTEKFKDIEELKKKIPYYKDK